MEDREYILENVFEFKKDIPQANSKLEVMPNLSIFEEKLNRELHKSRKNSKGIVLLFIDLDFFNRTNDILSFDHSDEFIELISKRYESYIKDKGLIYRLSEDKCLIAICDIDNIEYYYKNNLKELLKNIDQLTEIDDNDVYNNANIGISIYPYNGYNAKDLINNAKIAMYKSKELGRNQYYFFEENIYKEMTEKKEMIRDLRHALENDEFIIHYQPQVDIETNKIYGVEALLRWNSPKHGYMPPNKFIPLAEETGLIIEIGNWILREACKQSQKWKESGLIIKTSINISAIQLQDNYFLDNVKNIINETNVDPCLIDFEITESILIESTKRAQVVLKEIKEMGIKISLDDFGTGYSSLVYLNMFPIDTIKIDKSFIQELITSSTKTTIIEGIIYIAQNIGMKVTAEGIENKEELQLLKEKNCDNAQGYLFSKPLPINEVEVFFNEFIANAI